MTYTLVNLPFLLVTAATLLLLVVVRRRRRRTGRLWSALGVTLVGLLVLTAVFDNVIVGLGVVDYDRSVTSGIAVGLAPIEDFAYAVAAAVGLPALWCLLPPRLERGARNGKEGDR